MEIKHDLKLSIIIPVYNVEKYLKKCLDSMVNQDFENYELVIINDGTKDNSEKIIKEYILKYPNKIKYKKIENKGLSGARNEGLKLATGDYVAFFDSDDYIKKDMYQKMMAMLDIYQYDVVACDLYMEYENTGKLKEVKSRIPLNVTGMQREYKKLLIKDIYVAVHNKIYKKSVLWKDPFVEKMAYEDILFTYKLISKIKSIAAVHEPLYYYVQRPLSISNTFNEKLYDIPESIVMLKKYYQKQGMYEQYKDVIDYCAVRYCYGTFLKRLAKSKSKLKYDIGYQRVKGILEKEFPDYKKSCILKYSKSKKDLVLKHFNPLLKNLLYYYEKDKEN